ncbi:MAG: MFS transporter [Candidatus Thorarchaeota archaeon]
MRKYYGGNPQLANSGDAPAQEELVVCLAEPEKKRARLVGYSLTFLATFSLGVTELFAPWYAGELGAGPFIMGWAMGSFGLVYMVSPLIGGRVSDRIGRKASLIVATVAYLGILLVYPQPFIMPIHLVLLRALEGLFFGLFYPTIEAMVAELCPESQGAVLGNFASSWSLGMILSPFVLTFMATNFGNVTSIYVVFVVELAALALTVGLVRSYTIDQIQPRLQQEASFPFPAPEEIEDADKSDIRTSPRFMASYLSIALFGVVSTVLLAHFPSFVEDTLGYAILDFGSILVVWNVSRTIAFLGLTRTSQDRMGEVMVVGALLTAISMALVYFLTDLVFLSVAMALCGVGVGFSNLGGLYTVVSATENEKGAYAGIVESLAGLGFFVGPIAAGLIAEYSASLPYIVMALYAFITLIFVVILLSKSRK